MQPITRKPRRQSRLRAAFSCLMITAAAAAFFMLASPIIPALAGEEATTHRAGDLIVYRSACHDAESMTAVAERGGAAEIAVVLIQRGKCFINASPIPALLEAWISGPYPPPVGPAGSVWRVVDQFGNTEYVWFNDHGGVHDMEPSATLWPQSAIMA